MNKTSLISALIACAISTLSFADEPSTDESSTGSEHGELVSQITSDLTSGLKAASQDGKVSLIDAIKGMRRLGFGKSSSSSAGSTTQEVRGRGPGGASDEETSRGRGGRSSRGNDGGRPEGRGGSDSARGGVSSGGRGGMPTTDEEIKARFDERDTDKDGVWKADEINGYMGNQPAANDNVVTLEEYKQAWADLRAGRGGGGSHRHGGGGGHGHGGGGHGHGGGGHGGGRSVAATPLEDAKFFTSLDLNRDRQIELAEIESAVLADVRAAMNAEDASRRTGFRLQRRGRAIGRAMHLISALDAETAAVDEKVWKTAGLPSDDWEAFARGESSVAVEEAYQRLSRMR